MTQVADKQRRLAGYDGRENTDNIWHVVYIGKCVGVHRLSVSALPADRVDIGGREGENVTAQCYPWVKRPRKSEATTNWRRGEKGNTQKKTPWP